MTQTAFFQAQQNDLSILDDDFASKSSLSNWQTHHQTENWPGFTNKVEIKELESIFYIEPAISGWYGEFHRSHFYFKLVTGNFSVITKLKVTGINTLSPTKGFSLAGLMLRSPRPGNIPKDRKGYENWMFLSTGSATKNGKPQFESKNTIKGKSNLKVFPAKQGWIFLSISRIDNKFYQCYSYDGGQQWKLLRVIDRADMPNELQVGMLSYSGFWSLLKWYFNSHKFNTKESNNKSDLIARFDFVKFKRIENTNINEKYKAGFFNQEMSVDLLKELKLE